MDERDDRARYPYGGKSIEQRGNERRPVGESYRNYSERVDSAKADYKTGAKEIHDKVNDKLGGLADFVAENPQAITIALTAIEYIPVVGVAAEAAHVARAFMEYSKDRNLLKFGAKAVGSILPWFPTAAWHKGVDAVWSVMGKESKKDDKDKIIIGSPSGRVAGSNQYGPRR